MQAGTTPKKGTSLNRRAALKLMRLDGAPHADRAASDARVTKASSSIAVALLLISSGASATECQSSPGHDGKWWSYRIVDSKRCWYQGRPGRSKDLLQWAKQSPPPVVTRPDPGDSPPPAPPVPPQQPTETVTPKVVSTVPIPALSDANGRAPAVFARAAAIASQADEAVEVVDATLDHSSHRDRSGGCRITVSKERRQGTLFKNFRRRWTNWQARLAGRLDLMGDSITQWSRRASRPVQIETTSPSSERPSPRPWYWQRRNTPITPASCPNRPSSSLTTFDPRSLEIRELAEMNEWLIAFGDSLLAGVTRRPCISFGRPARQKTPLTGSCPPQRLMIADLAPIDHGPHRLAVTVYHHDVEGRREGVILDGLHQRVRVVSLVEPHRQHAAIWADGTKDAGLLHSDIDAVAQGLLKIFFHLWDSIGFRERVGE